jgi:chemotaxis protein histidine kinase CheA
MDKQLGMAEFFTMEAGEYLERLDALVSTPGNPNGEEFQRLTRALRGAALMANQQPIAAVAGAFEQVARAVREGRRSWDEAIRQLAIRAVDDLKLYVRRVREWADTDTARAHDLSQELEAIGGKAPHAAARGHATSPDAGTRAFVAREAAALASALARTVSALGRGADPHEPLAAVAHVMQPLRGLAGLSEFPPLGDLLDGIDRTAGAITRDPEQARSGAEVLEAGAKALTQATRELASSGRADVESAEIRRFADGLRRLLGLDEPAVPIEALYPDDAGPHVLERLSPKGVTELGRVELVALGEHLKQLASAMEQAAAPTLRSLRALGLADTLRMLEQGAGPALRSAAARLARAGRDAIARGVPIDNPGAIAGVLRHAGTALGMGEESALGRLADDLQALVPASPAVAGAAPPAVPQAPAPPAPPPTPAPVAVVAPAAPAVVTPTAPAPTPIPTPTPAAVREPPVAPRPPRPAAPAPAHHDEPADLAGSLMRYRRYLETLGLGAPSLSELLAGPPADPHQARPAPAPPVRTPTPAAAPAAPATVAAAEPVPITDLCYRGPAALERAVHLRERVDALFAAGVPTAEVQELVEEVFDLVQLGLDSGD